MKYLSAILTFILAVILQLWLAPAGMRGDFVLAILIVFAFLFEFWELVAFILLGVFLMNGAPRLGSAMLMLAVLPLAAYFLRRYFSLDPWLGVALGIAFGIIIFYAVLAPVAAFHSAGLLLVDILICIAFGELILCGIGDRQ